MKIPAVLILAAPADERYLEELTKFLVPLCHAQTLKVLIFNPIEPRGGGKCRSWTSQQLEKVDFVVLLLSQKLFCSQYWDLLFEQLASALDKAQQDQRPFTIIPVVLKPCLWEQDPFLAGLCAIPKNRMTINCKGFFNTVSEELQELITTMSAGRRQ